jgi:hypothetical protein
MALKIPLSRGCREMEHGAWSMGHGAWSMGHGAWGMGHGAESRENKRNQNYSETLW